jgi:hypothetical protein
MKFIRTSTTILNINNIFKSEWRLYNSELLKFWEWKTTHAPHMMCVALSPFVELQYVTLKLTQPPPQEKQRERV